MSWTYNDTVYVYLLGYRGCTIRTDELPLEENSQVSVLSTNGKMHAIFHSPVSLYYYHTCFMYRYIELMILWVLIPLLVIKQKESILRIVSEKLRKWIHLFVYYWKRFLLLCRNFEDFFKSSYFENITVHKIF